MQANNLKNLRGTCLIAGVLLAFTGAQAAAIPADAFPTFDSYIKISGQTADITGNKAAFERRLQQPNNGGLGIEDLHYSKEMDKGVTMEIDGRALAGAEDYLGKLRFTKEEVGSFEMGYKSFRTFYDGIGGFFPTSNTWKPLTPESLHTDRGAFWAEAVISLPNMPVFTLKYVDETRTGKKDSTIYGDTDFTGLPNNTPPISQVRKIIPSFLDLDERHKALEGTMTLTLDKTTVKVTLLNDKVDNLDTRYVTRFPEEVRIFPTPAATLLVAPERMNNQVVMSQTDGTDATMFLAQATSVTVFSDTLKLHAGINYQDTSNDFSGDRPMWTVTPTRVGNIVAPSNNYLNLMGNAKATVYTGNIAVDLKPNKDTSLKIGVRVEDKYTKSTGTMTSVTAAVNTTTGVITTTSTDQREYSRLKEKSWTPAVDFNYTGIDNVALYASASKRLVTGDDYYATPFSTSSPGNNNLSYSNPSEDHAYYNVGLDWHQSSMLNLRGDLFYKDHVTKAEGYGLSAGDFYNLATKFTGLKLTGTVKPSATVSFTTRYIYQTGEGQVTAPLSTNANYDSMDMTNHTISESIDWSPSTSVYVQANANLVFSVIKTVDGRAGTVAASGQNRSYDANNIVKDTNNNYVTLSLLAGAALTKTDDVQVQFTYYRANNWDPQMSALTVPYGAGAKESIVTVGLKHKFSDRCIGNFKLGYVDSKNDTTGGFTNFKGPLASVSLDFAL